MKHGVGRTLPLLTLCVSFAFAAVAFAQRPEFEVASIKENVNNGPSDFVPRRSGDLIVMHNTRLFVLFNYAYHLTDTYQMDRYDRFAEGFKWYDIEARAPGGATDDQVRLMFQSLLEDRFKVKLHRETRELPNFELVLDKGKLKLRPSSSEEPMKVTIEEKAFTQKAGVCSNTLWREGAHLVCHAATIATIADSVHSRMRGPVVDRTGLSGTYDLNILYLPEERRLEATAPPAPSFEQALQDELGLKLQRGKGPIEVLVIDHLEKPSDN